MNTDTKANRKVGTRFSVSERYFLYFRTSEKLVITTVFFVAGLVLLYGFYLYLLKETQKYFCEGCAVSREPGRKIECCATMLPVYHCNNNGRFPTSRIDVYRLLS